jgi:hypothetical protein
MILQEALSNKALEESGSKGKPNQEGNDRGTNKTG